MLQAMSVEGGLITESTSLTSFTRNQNKIDQDSRNDFSFVFCAAGNNTIFNKIYFFILILGGANCHCFGY